MNISPKDAIQRTTNYGVAGFDRHYPPEGYSIHQYIFTQYTSKIDKLSFDANANSAIVGYHLWQNTLAKASIVTHYERKK